MGLVEWVMKNMKIFQKQLTLKEKTYKKRKIIKCPIIVTNEEIEFIKLKFSIFPNFFFNLEILI